MITTMIAVMVAAAVTRAAFQLVVYGGIPRLWRPKASRGPLAASESKTDRLVAWHDAYNEVFDFADPEGSIYAALEAADKAVPPPLPPATLPNMKTKYGYTKPRKPLWAHTLDKHSTCPVCDQYGKCWDCGHQSLPGDVGSPMGSINAHDGYVDLKDGGLFLRMTSEEWIKQGRPSAKDAIKKWGPSPTERTPEEWKRDDDELVNAFLNGPRSQMDQRYAFEPGEPSEPY